VIKVTQEPAQLALALGGPQGRGSFASLTAGPSLSLQQPLMVQLQAGQPLTVTLFVGHGPQAGQPYYSNIVATPAAFGVMLQAGQPPTATLFMGIGETTDEIKRRVIRELNKVLKELEPKLSRISSEEIVRLIREDREGRD